MTKKENVGKKKRKHGKTGMKGLSQHKAHAPMSRFATERVNRRIGKLVSGREFESMDELNDFIQQALEKENREGAPEFPDDPAEAAQELAYRSMEERSDQKALELALKALEIDPDCIDARTVVIQITIHDPNEQIEAYRKLLAEARNKMGKGFFEENRGHFWGVVETRPFMRALESLAILLLSQERIGESIAVMEEMIDLNPNDNQGIRDALLGLYLGEGDILKAGMLLDRYSEDDLAVFSWGRAIERFLSGDMKAARKALTDAFESNPHVIAIMAGVEEMSDDFGGYSPGDINEARHCLLELEHVWEKQPDVISWIGSELPRLIRR